MPVSDNGQARSISAVVTREMRKNDDEGQSSRTSAQLKSLTSSVKGTVTDVCFFYRLVLSGKECRQHVLPFLLPHLFISLLSDGILF